MRANKLAKTSIWLLCLLLPVCASAGRPVRVYEIDIKGAPSAPALQDALRRVLVRATGRLEAADDVAFSALIADAARYMQSSRTRQDGATHVVFDGAALASAIAAAGHSVWDSNRPFTLVVLSPAPVGPAAESAHRDLDALAEARGLPISLLPLPLLDASGAELGREALLTSAQRLGADAILVGRGDAVGASWQWTLYTSFASESWTGPLDAGMNGAVDALARVEDSALSLAESQAFVEVDAVAALADYAAVDRLLEGVPGVSHVDIVEAHGNTAVFSVRVRGGAAALERALPSSGHFVAQTAVGGRLQYQYRP